MVVPLFQAQYQHKQKRLSEFKPILFSSFFLEDPRVFENIQKALEVCPRDLELMLTITRAKPYALFSESLISQGKRAIEIAGLKTFQPPLSNKTFVYDHEALSQFIFLSGVCAVSPLEYLRMCGNMELFLSYSKIQPMHMEIGLTTVTIYAEGLEGHVHFSALTSSDYERILEQYRGAIKNLEHLGVKNLGRIIAELRTTQKAGVEMATTLILA